jgi:hypothetical protein
MLLLLLLLPLLRYHPKVLPPVEALLDVVTHPDRDIYEMAFAFWVKLSRQLASPVSSSVACSGSSGQQQQTLPGPPGLVNGQPAASAAGGGDAEQQRQREFFRPVLEKLVGLVRGRMRCVAVYGVLSLSQALPLTL